MAWTATGLTASAGSLPGNMSVLAHIAIWCYGYVALIPDALLEEASRRFALLGDPSRLRVLSVLHSAGELPVGVLAERSGLTRTNLSQHLSRLAVAGLVGRRRSGTTIYYRIVDESLTELCDLVCSSLRERGRALAAS